jgi:O-antigen/teichoic acid export membrane protein
METKKNIFYNVILALSQVLFPLITFPYLARTLGPEHVGLINFSESFARYFILLAAVGIPIYGVREIAKTQNDLEERSKVFLEIFIINIITTISLSAIYLFCIFHFEKLYIEKSLFIWSLVFFFLNIFYLEWFFAGMNQFKFIAIRFFIVRLLLVFIVFVFIKSKQDYIVYMKMNVVLSIVVGFLNFISLKKLIIVNFKNLFDLEIKKHIKPLLYLFLTIFSISIYLFLDSVILGFLTDNESVGYYSSALKLNKLIIAVLSAISAAMFPKLVTLYQNGEYDKFNEMVKTCFTIILSLSLPAVILVFGCSSEIVEILFGEHFQRAVLPLQITSPIILIVSMSTIFGFQILSALSKDREILISAVSGMLLSILLSIFLVLKYKEIGEAITILVTELLVCIIFIYFSKKFFSIKKYNKIILEQITSIIPYILIIFLFKQIIDNIFIRVIAICSFSLLWFLTFHFVLLRNGLFKRHFLNFFIEKTSNIINE